MDLSIVIPCYNEVDNVTKIQTELFPVVHQLAQTQAVEVIFVDDGSRDGTWQAFTTAFRQADQPPNVTLKFERHPVNRGLGAAIRTGLAAASGDIIVTTDSDGTYKFSEIPTLLSYLTPDVDIVTASPYHPQGGIKNVPKYRLILSQGASALYRILARWNIHTYTALFRAYRRQVADDVPFESNGFLGGTELMINAIRMGYTVAEYPTVLHSRVNGTSKAKLARTIKSHLRFQLQVVLPWHPYGMLLQGSNDNVYLYTNFQKRLFPSAGVFLSHGYAWNQIIRVSDQYLAQLDTGLPMTFREGTLVTGADKTVYWVEHGQKRPIKSAEIFEGLGLRWENVLTVPPEVLDSLETGPEINSLERHPDGALLKTAGDETVFRLENGQKRPFNTVQAFLSWGHTWEQVVTVGPGELQLYPTGLPVVPQKSFYGEYGDVTGIKIEGQARTRPLANLGTAIHTLFSKRPLQIKPKF